MNEITCSCDCWIRYDLQKAEDKLFLLKDNWPSFFDMESIAVLPKDELKCAMCLLDIVLEAPPRKKYSLSKTEIKNLITIRSFMSTVNQSSETTDRHSASSDL